MPECNRENCEEPAVANIIGPDGYHKAHRCEDHLVIDLEL